MPQKGRALTKRQVLIKAADFILFNSMIFHIVLSNNFYKVNSPRNAPDSQLQDFLLDEWGKIARTINFLSVFTLGIDILRSLPAGPETEKRLQLLCQGAASVVSSGVLKRADFLGEIYNKLLLRVTGHYFATYYTTRVASTLLSSFALSYSPKISSYSIDELENLRVIDPACGSGSLLKSIYSRAETQHIFRHGSASDLPTFHKVMLEQVLHGWDVLDFAGHLTATSLGLMGGIIPSVGSNIYVLQVGVDKAGKVHLGSLDYLKRGTLQGLSLTPDAAKQTATQPRRTRIAVAEYDIVIMNPPFTRSAKPSKTFGFLSSQDRDTCQDSLADLGRELELTGAGVGGMGPYFVELSRALTSDEGVVALVLPKSILSSVSYRVLRQRLSEEFDVRVIVSNFDAGDVDDYGHPWAWSSHTDLGEVLIVLTRKTQGTEPPCRYLNIIRCPKTPLEAGSLFSEFENRGTHDCRLGAGVPEAIQDRRGTIAYVSDLSQCEKGHNWLLGACFAQPDLNKLAFQVTTSPDLKPLYSQHIDRRTGTGFCDGYDISPLKQNFEESSSRTAYPVVWGHQQTMTHIELDAKYIGYGTPKRAGAVGRFDKYAGTLLICDRVHLKTESLVAKRTTKPVLATAFWEMSPVDLKSELMLLTWLNSTYGLLYFLSNAISQKADEFMLKKAQLRALVAPPRDCVDEASVQHLFDQVKGQSFECYGKEFELAAKGKGNRVILDKFWNSVLGLPYIRSELYNLLAVEPVFLRKSRNILESFSKV